MDRQWASRPNGLTMPFHNCDWINYELDCVKFWPLITLDACVSPYTKDSSRWSCTKTLRRIHNSWSSTLVLYIRSTHCHLLGEIHASLSAADVSASRSSVVSTWSTQNTTEDSRKTVKIRDLRALGSPILAKSALTKIWSSLVRVVLGIDALIRVVLGLSTVFFSHSAWQRKGPSLPVISPYDTVYDKLKYLRGV